MFFCEICEICKNTYFEEHMLTAPSVIRLVSSSQAINRDKIVHDVINSFNVDFMFPKNKIIMKEPGNCKNLITLFRYTATVSLLFRDLQQNLILFPKTRLCHKHCQIMKVSRKYFSRV